VKIKSEGIPKNTFNCRGFLLEIGGLQTAEQIDGEGAGKNTSNCKGFLLAIRGLPLIAEVSS